MNTLLHIGQDSNITSVNTEPSADELSAFENDGLGLELDPMIPYLDELDSKWNDRLCELFILHLKDDDEMEVTSDNEHTIAEMFHNRLQRLQRERHRNTIRAGEGPQEGQQRINQARLGKLARQRPNSRCHTVSLTIYYRENVRSHQT